MSSANRFDDQLAGNGIGPLTDKTQRQPGRQMFDKSLFGGPHPLRLHFQVEALGREKSVATYRAMLDLSQLQGEMTAQSSGTLQALAPIDGMQQFGNQGRSGLGAADDVRHPLRGAIRQHSFPAEVSSLEKISAPRHRYVLAMGLGPLAYRRPGHATRQFFEQALQYLLVEIAPLLETEQRAVIGSHKIEAAIEARILLPADIDLGQQRHQSIPIRLAATQPTVEVITAGDVAMLTAGIQRMHLGAVPVADQHERQR